MSFGSTSSGEAKRKVSIPDCPPGVAKFKDVVYVEQRDTSVKTPPRRSGIVVGSEDESSGSRFSSVG